MALKFIRDHDTHQAYFYQDMQPEPITFFYRDKLLQLLDAILRIGFLNSVTSHTGCHWGLARVHQFLYWFLLCRESMWFKRVMLNSLRVSHLVSFVGTILEIKLFYYIFFSLLKSWEKVMWLKCVTWTVQIYENITWFLTTTIMKALSQDQTTNILSLLNQGYSSCQIASQTGVEHSCTLLSIIFEISTLQTLRRAKVVI